MQKKIGEWEKFQEEPGFVSYVTRFDNGKIKNAVSIQNLGKYAKNGLNWIVVIKYHHAGFEFTNYFPNKPAAWKFAKMYMEANPQGNRPRKKDTKSEHIKTRYSSSGLLKVSMYKEDNGYRVVGKSRIKRGREIPDWRIVDDYRALSRKKAKTMFKRIYDMF